ncbi:hypothetical protein RDWZM_010167 [Blomia tropicalis]|uniref:Ig-like domain-containing protein n=1 Tax=Blomia tropicalis TaxID=40697 RepID=A0A9Q0M0G6_BLOTA|nr:hypothetical protein RDWZM_010167 [Blomia tropicalis]
MDHHFVWIYVIVLSLTVPPYQTVSSNEHVTVTTLINSEAHLNCPIGSITDDCYYLKHDHRMIEDDWITHCYWFRSRHGEPLAIVTVEREMTQWSTSLSPLSSSLANRTTFMTMSKTYPRTYDRDRVTIQLDCISRQCRLRIRNVTQRDEGDYRCRLDRRRSRTTMNDYHLNVIVKPPAKVLWYEGRTLIGDNYRSMRFNNNDNDQTKQWINCTGDGNSECKTINELILYGKLTRSDHNRMFRCVAQNTELMAPIEASITIKLILPPETVVIANGPDVVFVAGRDERLVCRAFGSFPIAQLSWLKNGLPAPESIEGYYDNLRNHSVSILSFIPKWTDDGTEFTCEGVASHSSYELIRSPIIRDSVIVTVHDIPRLVLTYSLQYGTEANVFHVDDTVHFVCNVYSKPSIERIYWLHNRQLVLSDDQYIFIKNGSMTIRGLQYEKHNGNWSCLAENRIGRQMSNVIFIDVIYSPKCSKSNQHTYQVGINETIAIVCNIDSNPGTQYFSWYYNQTELIRYNKSTDGRQSILFYMPTDQWSFGIVKCTARNIAGPMVEPCLFHLKQYGLPHSIRRCHALELANKMEQTITNERKRIGPIAIQCYFDSDGGLPTICNGSLYRRNNRVPDWAGINVDIPNDKQRQNHKSSSCRFEPPISINLDDEYRFVVHTANDRGPSLKIAEFKLSIRALIRRRPNQSSLSQLIFDRITNETQDEDEDKIENGDYHSSSWSSIFMLYPLQMIATILVFLAIFITCCCTIRLLIVRCCCISTSTSLQQSTPSSSRLSTTTRPFPIDHANSTIMVEDDYYYYYYKNEEETDPYI